MFFSSLKVVNWKQVISLYFLPFSSCGFGQINVKAHTFQLPLYLIHLENTSQSCSGATKSAVQTVWGTCHPHCQQQSSKILRHKGTSVKCPPETAYLMCVCACMCACVCKHRCLKNQVLGMWTTKAVKICWWFLHEACSRQGWCRTQEVAREQDRDWGQ